MDFCYKTAEVWQIIGYAFLVLKIVIPIILVVLGIVDIGKAVLSSDEKLIKDGVMKLVKRVIAAVIIFFIPTVINVLFQFIGGFSESIRNDYDNCIDCLTSPNGNCDTSYDDNMFE
ncbi:MAG TPA: hypothetical protein IAB40_06880 [Candidatus Onthocola stercoravium]|nr:hypothetical protein [Candidatus Onthocola stercoravium]